MIARIAGTLLERELEGVVVDCGGVGYALACSLTSLAALPATGAQVVLHVYTHVAEDALRLYGFVTHDERRTFTALIATTGVGPKLALAILSTLGPGELRAAVQGRDKTALTRIPGVGGKKAERLLLELQDRLSGEAAAHAPLVLGGSSARLADLRSALMNLGFVRDVADKAAKKAQETQAADADLATLVRAALRTTTQRHG